MASRLLRRSGVAVGVVCDLIGWRPDLIVQVGVGQHHEEVDVLSAEWPGVEWLGFEPHPQTFADVAGAYPGCLVNAAVSDRPGEAEFFMKKHHADGSSLLFHDRIPNQGVSSVRVRATTLDAECGTIPQQVLLWLDCEGSELAALKGGRRVLVRTGVVNVEMTARPPGSGWCSPRDVHELLTGRGFLRQWVHTGKMSAGQYDAVYVRAGLFREEYSCDPFA